MNFKIKVKESDPYRKYDSLIYTSNSLTTINRRQSIHKSREVSSMLQYYT